MDNIRIEPIRSLHHDELENRICNIITSGSKSLDLNFILDDPDTLKKLVEIMREDTHFSELFLSYNSINTSGFIMIASIFKTNNSLHFLDLSTNLICSDKRASEYISDLISSNKSLHYLDLGYNCIDSRSVDNIVRSLYSNTTLHMLDLSSSYIDIDTAEEIYKMLCSNNSLRSFRLNSCRMNTEKSVKIVNALRINTQLEELHLNNNVIDNIGACEICKILCENNILTHLYLNNNMIDTSGIFEIFRSLSSLSDLSIGENKTLQYLEIRNSKHCYEEAEHIQKIEEILESNYSLTEVRMSITSDKIKEFIERNKNILNLFGGCRFATTKRAV